MPDPALPRKARISRKALARVAVQIAVRVAVRVTVRVGTRIAGAEVRGGVGSAARVPVLAENPRAVRRTVNPNRDRDGPEVLAMLKVLCQHRSETHVNLPV